MHLHNLSYTHLHIFIFLICFFIRHPLFGISLFYLFFCLFCFFCACFFFFSFSPAFSRQDSSSFAFSALFASSFSFSSFICSSCTESCCFCKTTSGVVVSKLTDNCFVILGNSLCIISL